MSALVPRSPPDPPDGVTTPAWFRRYWPVVTGVGSWSIMVILLTVDLAQDWTVATQALPGYAALLAAGASGVSLGRKPS